MYLQRLIRPLIFILIFGGVIFYTGFALRNALRGPHITMRPIQSPVEAPVVTLSGSVVRAESVTVNSLSIPITTEGTFGITTALVEGDNEFLIEASDRFGSKHAEHVHVFHTPAPTVQPVETTSASSPEKTPPPPSKQE